jgi:hypothetical protein
MVYDTRDYWVFGLRPSSGILNNTAFRKLICFRPQVRGWETPILLGPLERANLSHWMILIEISSFYLTQQSRGLPPPRLKMETDPVSETLCFLVSYRIPDDGQSPKSL